MDQLARDILGRPIRDSLGKGEEPYSMLVGTRTDAGQSVGQFAERLFHQVAQEHRQSLRGLGGERALQAALEKRVRKVVAEGDPATSDVPDALAIVCRIAVNLFEHSGMSEERAVAQKAASLIGYLELINRSWESGATWYERLLAIKSIEPGDGTTTLGDYHRQNLQRLEILRGLAVIYKRLDWPVKQARTLRRLFTEAANFPPGDLYQIFLGATDRASAARRLH